VSGPSQGALPSLEREVALSERQALALTIIRTRGPISSGELGALVREARGGRITGAEFDQSNGRKLGDALAREGLVRYWRGSGWVDGEVLTHELLADSYDPATAEIPF